MYGGHFVPECWLSISGGGVGLVDTARQPGNMRQGQRGEPLAVSSERWHGLQRSVPITSLGVFVFMDRGTVWEKVRMIPRALDWNMGFSFHEAHNPCA